ncbi:MAG: asparagine synthase (glutamine-hydrolyzing) [Alteromonadaceae bacterium]
MCGFAGFLTPHLAADERLNILDAMGKSLYHRGPDHIDVYAQNDCNLGMVHTRLSILDLSPLGSQPMVSHSGSSVISFNGEIYNYQEIKVDLIEKGIIFKGDSDTEVLLESIEYYGLDETLKKVRGMFAFAFFDFLSQSLYLCRDRAGEKPLYYTACNGEITFGSELKALMCWPSFSKRLESGALTQFLSHGFVNSDHSIFEGVTKLPPSTVIKFTKVDGKWSSVEQYTYWNLLASKQGIEISKSIDYVEKLDGILFSAVQEQLIADVPIGAFLSGGIDSSLIVAMMSKASNDTINTFSIGFDDKEYNEAEHAKLVAKHLGTNHETLYVTDSQIMDIIPNLPKIYDEPMSDMSQIPTYLVSQLARKSVTVALTGDAADEIFGGYNRYLWANKMAGVNQKIPSAVRLLISRLLMYFSPANYDKLTRFFPPKYQVSEFGLKVHKALSSFSASDNIMMYEMILNQFSHFKGVRTPSKFRFVSAEYMNEFKCLSIAEQFMVLDFMNYMSDGVLCKVDRAAMANSLETRSPFLDKRVIEFGMALPVDYKFRNGQSKWILRELLKRYIPKDLFERPKMGFAVPMGKWLRGPLKEWSYVL